MSSHYDVLGVVPDASGDDIKRAYYRKARAYHPDAHVGSADGVQEEAAKAMAALNQAWNVLRDGTLRTDYDRALAAAADRLLAAKRERRRQGRPDDSPSPLALVGNGFRHWLAAATLAGTDGGMRLSLSIDGATDLEPLRLLAPDGLVALHAARAAIDDRQLVHLQPLAALQVLDLSETGVTDAGLLHLAGLERLESLSLWGTSVTDEGLRLLGRITSLRYLGLGETAITDAGLDAVSGLSDLRVLQLWGTAVAGPGLAHLHRHPRLEIVSLPWKVRGHHRRRLRRALPGALVI
jgi:DnaJ-domain-containing protein 1